MKKVLARGLVAGAVALGLAACSADKLVVPNQLNPTPGSVTGDPRNALQLQITGILRSEIAQMPGYVSGVGILGRESYSYPPTEGRNVTGWLGVSVQEQTSFGGVGLWSGYHAILRDLFNLQALVDAAPAGTWTAAEIRGIQGFIWTTEATQLLYLINTRNQLGIPVEQMANPAELAPFVSRDSVFRRIIGRLDAAAGELSQAGAAFPFLLHGGYAGFNTPVNYRRHNRALAARVNAYRASMGVGGCTALSQTCYNQVLTNLQESFINEAAATPAALRAGPFNVFTGTTGHVANTISNAATAFILAHVSYTGDAQRKPDNSFDNRYATKILTQAPRDAGNPDIAVATPLDFTLYATREDPIPIITNEELLLLRAEARYFTGDAPGALQDLNRVRTVAGGLPALSGFASDAAFISALLYERRFSLMFTGHRWIDHRRFGRLGDLPLDIPTGPNRHIVVDKLPVPQGECLNRSGQTGALAGPGCVG